VVLEGGGRTQRGEGKLCERGGGRWAFPIYGLGSCRKLRLVLVSGYNGR